MRIRRVAFQAAQQAVYDILSAKQTEMAVYDHIPEDARYPCVYFGGFSSESVGAKVDTDMQKISMEIIVRSSDTSKQEIQLRADDVMALLTAWPLDAAALGWQSLNQDVTTVEIFEADDFGYYALLTFTATMQKI